MSSPGDGWLFNAPPSRFIIIIMRANSMLLLSCSLDISSNIITRRLWLTTAGLFRATSVGLTAFV